MQLSTSQLGLVRQQPQRTELNLSIFQPVAIFKAQVNDVSIGLGARVITFDSVSLGLYTYLQDGMTMWVGLTPGGQELGKIRIRSATSTQITVSENDDVDWRDRAYLTVFRYHELWPIYPRIIIDPSNSENVIFYKDFDIVYTNQNSILGTFVNAGSHRAAILDPLSNQTQIYYSSTGSYNLLGDSLTYDWFFEGATVTGSSLATPGYIIYNQVGQYETRLTISGSSGGVDTAYRYISIYDNLNPPIQKWQLQGLSGSRDEGGYTASIRIFDIIPIQENAIVILFGNSWYGNIQTNLGGNAQNSSDIFFVGYIDKDSIQYDYEHSEISFDAVSLTETMKKTSGFSVSVKSVASPTKWYELLDMDGKRALYHYLKWHTTALALEDVQFIGDDPPIQYFDSDRGSMYDAIHNYMQNALIGNVVSDRQGKMWLEVEARAYPNPTGTFGNSVMSIDKRDWMNTPNIDERLIDDASYLEYGGIAYSGVATGTFAALIGSAPGNAPGFYGSIDNHEGMALRGQEQLNQLVGNLLANKNSPYPTINMDMSETLTNLDIAPQETLGIHITKNDTIRNLAIDGLYIPSSMSWRYDSVEHRLLLQLESSQLVTGKTGQTVIIPSVNDVGGGFVFDPFSTSFPPLPDIFAPTGLDTGDGAPRTVIVHLAERLGIKYGLAYTSNFNSPFPAWIQWNTGLTSDQYNNIDLIYTCPNGSVYVACTTSTPSTLGFLARAPGVGQPFTILEDSTSMVAKMGTSDNVRLCAIGVNRTTPEQIVYGISAQSDAVKLYIGSNGTYSNSITFAGQFTNNGSSISFGSGNWVWTCSSALILNSGATAIVATRSTPDTVITGPATRHIQVGSSGFTIHWGNTDIALGTNNASSYVGPFTPPLSTTAYLHQNMLACSLTGRYVMTGDGGLNYRSTDFGYSWSVGYISPVSAKVDASQTLEGGFVIAGGVTVQWTANAGSTWTNKIGDLLNIDPFGVCDAVAIVQ
jgi:hypothetical protein